MATRFEKEIEDLLRSIGEFGPKESWWQKLNRVGAARLRGTLEGVKQLPYAVPADQLMLTAILLIVASYFLRFAFRPLATVVGAVGLVMFFTAFVISFRYFFGASKQVRWRGHTIDMRHDRQSPFARLTRWFRRRLRGY